MSLTNSLKKIFFLTNSNKNQSIEISKINICLSKHKNRRINKNNRSNNIFSIYDKRHYKLNKDINIFPSPERLKSHKYSPVCIKTGQISQNINRKKMHNPEFYLPIMKKTEVNDPFESMLVEDFLDISHNYKPKKDLSFQKNRIGNPNNKNINKDKAKDSEDENEMSMVIRYSFDRFGKPKIKRNMFNLDAYNNNVEQNKIVNILTKMNSKRKNHKEQILMRNKFQHTKKYNKRIMPLSKDDIQSEYNKYVDFNNEAIRNKLNTENKEMKSYDSKEIYAKNIISEKMPNYKVTGFDQLYMNLLTSIRPNKIDSSINTNLNNNI